MAKQPLPLYPGAKPCVRSGFCCKQAPCGYGDWNENKTQCKHLVKENGQYACAIYEQITESPGWEFSPAFGAGCCSPLNTDRRRIIQEAIHRATGTVSGTTQ